jgi:uncharacterized membrane protein
MTTALRPGRLVPAGLVVLGLIPALGGGLRLAQLTSGAEVTPANERFFAAPLPVTLHIVGATVFCLVGAFQFAPRLRGRRPRWHRLAGRVLVPCGLTAALTGLWMSLFYQRPPGDGDLLTAFRLVFGTAMAVSIVLGFLAVRRRDFARHRAWMIRGYAIGIGAGTQAFTLMPLLLTGNPHDELGRALLMAAGWLLNLAVAEWAVRRPVTVRVPTPQPLEAR